MKFVAFAYKGQGMSTPIDVKTTSKALLSLASQHPLLRIVRENKQGAMTLVAEFTNGQRTYPAPVVRSNS